MNYLFIFSLIQDSSVSIDSGYSGEVWYSRVYLEQVTGATGAGWWMCKAGDLSQTARYTCSNRGCLMIVKKPASFYYILQHYYYHSIKTFVCLSSTKICVCKPFETRLYSVRLYAAHTGIAAEFMRVSKRFDKQAKVLRVPL